MCSPEVDEMKTLERKCELKAQNDVLLGKAYVRYIYDIENKDKYMEVVYRDKENFGEEYNVHLAENVYAYIHIDTTFVFVGEGKVLLNPTRVNERNIPEFLRPFDKIWAPEPYPTQVLDDWCPASPWLGMNILPINDKLIMVEEHQTLLMKELKKWGIDTLPVKMRHARTFSGGPHCVTLDVVRGE